MAEDRRPGSLEQWPLLAVGFDNLEGGPHLESSIIRSICFLLLFSFFGGKLSICFQASQEIQLKKAVFPFPSAP